MYSTRSLSFISFGILLIFLTISFYYGIISPPPLGTYTADENIIGDSGVFLIYGNTPRTLEWPALPSIFIAYLIFIVWCGISLVSKLSSIYGITDILFIIDKNTFYYLNHREEFIYWERTIQILIVGIILYQTIKFILRSKHPLLINNEMKGSLAIFLMGIDIFWINVAVIRPEAIAGSLFLFILFLVIFSEKITMKNAGVILVFLIITISQRLLFLFLSPFIIGGIIIYLRKQDVNWKTYLKYLWVILVTFFAFMPFFITNTLVALKSFVGAIFIKMNYNQMTTIFNMDYLKEFIVKPSNVFLLLFSVIGSYFLLKKHPSKILIALFLGNSLYLLFTSLKSSQLYSTHTFPLTIISIILIGFGVGSILEMIKIQRYKRLAFTIMIGVVMVNSLGGVIKSNIETINQQRNLAEAINWVKSLNNNEKIALELDFDGYIPKSKACLSRESEANSNKKYRINKLYKLLKLPHKDSLAEYSLPIIAKSFAFEDEEMFDMQYQVTLKYIDTNTIKRFDTDYFFENNDMMSHCLLRQDALNGFEAGKYHYLISKSKLDNMVSVKSFIKPGGINFWVYESKKAF